MLGTGRPEGRPAVFSASSTIPSSVGLVSGRGAVGPRRTAIILLEVLSSHDRVGHDRELTADDMFLEVLLYPRKGQIRPLTADHRSRKLEPPEEASILIVAEGQTLGKLENGQC